jgi:hypothetical protein
MRAHRDNLTARIAEAEQEGWRGGAENLGVSLARANDKLTQLDARARRTATINRRSMLVPPPNRFGTHAHADVSV